MDKPISKECKLSNKDLVSNVRNWVDSFCKTGGKSWSLRVPVDFNHDPDMTILSLCERFESIESTLEEVTRQQNRAVELLEHWNKWAMIVPMAIPNCPMEKTEIFLQSITAKENN